VRTHIFTNYPHNKRRYAKAGDSIDHYIGPGRIVRHIGTRSVVVVIKDDHDVDREYQRDAGMVLLKKRRPNDADPDFMKYQSMGTRLCSKDDLNLHALKEGEIIILKDEPEAKDWYCAEVRAVLADRIEVNYFTTQTPALEDYDECSIQKRKERLGEALLLRTWCLRGGKGEATTNPPSTKYARTNHLWWGRIPMEDVTNHILVRDVGLDATGKLDKNTIKFASNLRIPHHQGAGGEDDFFTKEAFQRQMKRNNNKKKR
jgi:hypothetical protein